VGFFEEKTPLIHSESLKVITIFDNGAERLFPISFPIHKLINSYLKHIS
jgi:hypothetical protein